MATEIKPIANYFIFCQSNTANRVFAGVRKTAIGGPEAEQGGARTKAFHPARVTAGSSSQGRRAVTHSQLPLLRSLTKCHVLSYPSNKR